MYIVSQKQLICQKRKFRNFRNNILKSQKDRLKQISDEDTKKHLKELADVLNRELDKYQQNIKQECFYNLKVMIKTDVEDMNLDNLTILYRIFFTTPNSDIVNELKKMSKDDDSDREEC